MKKGSEIEIIGYVKRVDVKIIKTKKDKKEMALCTVTVSANGNDIKVDTFSMKLNKNGDEELAQYKGIMTILEEYKTLHKTLKVGDKDAKVIKDDTIVESLEECDIVSVGNYKSKFCRLGLDKYQGNDGNMVEKVKINANFISRLDKDKFKEEKNTFEINGILKQPAIEMMDMEDNPYVKLVVAVAKYQEGYGEREEKLDLNTFTFEVRTPEGIDYAVDTFDREGMPIYLNGDIIRHIERVEVQSASNEDEGRGFGRKLEKKLVYETKVEERLEILGGWELEEEDIEGEKIFDVELLKKALEEQSKKVEEQEKNKKGGFGKPNGNKPSGNVGLPF